MQGGFIWLFYGSQQLPVDERPPIPLVPELEDPAWKPVRAPAARTRLGLDRPCACSCPSSTSCVSPGACW